MYNDIKTGLVSLTFRVKEKGKKGERGELYCIRKWFVD